MIKPHCLYSEINFIIKQTLKPTTFDRTLLSSWKTAESANALNYKIAECNLISKVVPVGKCDFVVTLNEKRFSNRRKPQEMNDLNQPFDHSKFNFTKVNEKEILMTFGLASQQRTNKPNVIIVNASPFQTGHALLVPELNSCHNQVMRKTPLRTALEALLISGEETFTVAFNSMLACASVNHLHFHLWTNGRPLVCASLDLAPLIGADIVFQMPDHPVRNFVVHFTDLDNIDNDFETLWRIVATLQSIGVPHSICLLRSTPGRGVPGTAGIRAIVWPRNTDADHDLKLSVDKVNSVCNVAVAEMAGHIFTGDRDFFQNDISPQLLDSSFKRVQLADDKWNEAIALLTHSFI